jgi:uncharacterized protein with PIN domain
MFVDAGAVVSIMKEEETAAAYERALEQGGAWTSPLARMPKRRRIRC